MIGLRSFLFHLSVCLVTLVEGIAFLPLLIFAPQEIPKLWTASVLFLARRICHIEHIVRGSIHVPHGACILAAKHQSAWETFALWHILPHPVFVLKKELLRIPIFGWYLAATPVIAIDRKGGSAAIKSIVEQAKEHLAAGRQIVIFPEGTRQPVGQTGRYGRGIAALYNACSAPVIPVALNSGIYWSKKSLIRKPGKIIMEFLHPIEPRLSSNEFMVELQKQIEFGSARLLAEATA